MGEHRDARAQPSGREVSTQRGQKGWRAGSHPSTRGTGQGGVEQKQPMGAEEVGKGASGEEEGRHTRGGSPSTGRGAVLGACWERKSSQGRLPTSL